MSENLRVLTRDQIATFLEDGVLVIPQVFTAEEVEEASQGFHQFLKEMMNIDHDDLKQSTGFSNIRLAGIVDCFWQKWKMKLNSHPRFIAAMQDLYEATYSSEKASNRDDLFYSPFSASRKDDNPSGLFYYIDRANYRVPKTILSGMSLALHVDCDPKFLYELLPITTQEVEETARDLEALLTAADEQKVGANIIQLKRNHRYKWRPIQSFVALTDNPAGELGGFRAVKGFFKEILKEEWKCQMMNNKPNQEFTVLEHLKELKERTEDIVYKKGDVVVWDWRTPHTNSKEHLGSFPREAAYIQVMPDVPVNRLYAQAQRRAYIKGHLYPFDFSMNAAFKEGFVGGEWKPLSIDEKILLGMSIAKEDVSTNVLGKELIHSS